MRAQLIFLLLYSGVLGFGVVCSAQQNGGCDNFTQHNCTASPDPTAAFLMCVGVPEGPGAGQQHILNLKGLIDATLDIYSFLRSSLSGVPVLNISGEFSVNWASLLQDDDFIRFWLQVRLTPLLSSISQNFLTCLSNSNFSCSTYSTMVQELSQHFSGLDPERQKWIYSFFMYPFLSRNTSAGCVDPGLSSEDWLIKNFGSFSVLARIRDFTSINLLFNGMEVLHLLSPEQKAELILNPELANLHNDSLGVVLDSLLTSVMTPNGSVTSPPNGSVWLPPIYPPSVQDPVTQVMNDFMTAFKPVGSFVREFVSLTHQPDLSSMSRATFVQAMLNWTLAELAAPYKQNGSNDVVAFDPTDVNAWFSHVVAPVLRRFLPGEIPSDITEVFHSLFYIEMSGNSNDQDLCKITLEEPECAVNNMMQHVAKILHCAASTNLTLTSETLDSLALQLTTSLNTLLNQLAMTNFSAPDSPFIHILDRLHDLSPYNLQDEQFISMWFQIKLKPRLSTLTPDYLLCLSAKPFSCQTYQILVREMSNNMFLMSESGPFLVYYDFITPFLSGQIETGACMTNSSSEWIRMNLAGFSAWAPLRDLYLLSRDFNALEALDVLTPRQTAELIVENLPHLPEKKQVIDIVFDFLLGAPVQRNLPEVLFNLTGLLELERLECSYIQQIAQRLYAAVVPMEMKQIIQDTIDSLGLIAPADCLLLPPATCLSIQVNESVICAGVNSTGLLAQMNISCVTSVAELACSQVTGLTADGLAKLLNCSLSNNVTYSKEIWKLLFTKADGVLTQALNIFSSNMVFPIRGVSASNILDAIVDVRLGQFTPNSYYSVDFIKYLFSHELRPFLPSASRDLLYCISSKNFSCQAYQLIVMEFGDPILFLDEAEKLRVLKDFILPFLTKNSTDPACVSSTNSSVEWLLRNFGPFAELMNLRQLISLNPHFNPLLALPYLTPLQTAELIVEDLPTLPDKESTINSVFDFLLQSSWQHRLPEVLQDILMMRVMPCSSYTVISRRLFWALALVSQDSEPEIFRLVTLLEQLAPQHCPMTPLPTCFVTTVNESQICEGVSRPSSEELLKELHNGSCVFRLEQYACSRLDGFSSKDLASLLRCSLYNNVIYPNAVWKLLFMKEDNILNQALLIFSNMAGNQSLPIRGAAVSNVLDVIGEVRMEQFTPQQWNDAAFISRFFRENLRPYLSSVSRNFLSCLMTKNLSCQTFQDILQEFSSESIYMDAVNHERENVLNDFILPFMHRNTRDPGCVSSTNNSVEWLLRNFGPFAEFLSLRDLISLNPHFNPVLALPYLTPLQTAELMVLDVPGIPNDYAINSVFNFLIESPGAHRMSDVLSSLFYLSPTVTIQCTSYKLIFMRLLEALQSVPSDIHPVIWGSINDLMQTSPKECLPAALKCPVTAYNESQMCQGVDSSAVQTLITTGGSAESWCRISLQNYSCANLDRLTALQLSTLLQCQLTSNEVYSKEVWKLFFSKVSGVLDNALVLLFRKTVSVNGPNAPVVLEVLAELRLGQFTPDQWASGQVVSTWLKDHLAPFLPSVSGIFLYCLSSNNLTCQSYQNILAVFNDEFSAMDGARTELVLKYFIEPILTSNSTGGCISYNSTEWLLRNFGLFSQFVTLKQLMSINRNFNPLLALPYLTPLQTAELMVEDLTGLPNKPTIINTVFDFLLQPPWRYRLPEVLQELSVLAGTMPLSCVIYQTIFSRLEGILTSSPGDLEPVIWASVYDLTPKAPAGCPLFPLNQQCPASPFSVTAVCQGNQSIFMQQYVGNGTLTVPCDLPIPEYACAKSLNISSDELVCILENTLKNDSSFDTVEAWKLFLTRGSNQLDSALLKLSSQAAWYSTAQASNFLNAVRELRLDRFSADELVNNSFISLWFGGLLRPVLPSASATFLICMSSRNFSCQTFQTIVQVFNNDFSSLNSFQLWMVTNQFILNFLSRERAESACVSNNSAQWLIKNFGNFSSLMSLSQILHLNPQFNPLEVLSYLSPFQIVELFFFDLPGLPAKEVIINAVFDFLTASSREYQLAETLDYLSYFIDAVHPNVSCSSYRIIFRRLDYLFPNVPMDLEYMIVHTKSILLKNVPAGCVIYSGECNTTLVNGSAVCSGVDGSALMNYLLGPRNSSQLCSFSITQYACAELIGLTPEDLVTVLMCNLHGNSTVSDETWKLFITNVNPVLGPALDLFTNTTLPWSRPLVVVLDMIGEVTLGTFSSSNYRNSSFIQRWIQTRLRPFLPYASPRFLSCLASKDFSCASFQSVVKIFSQQFSAMSRDTNIYIWIDFIQVFLSLNQTAGCSAGMSSSDWLSMNFGPFSAFASLTALQRLNPNFKPLDVLDRLTLGQLAQVASSPGLLSTPAQVDPLMKYVPDSELSVFFSTLSAALSSQGGQLTVEVKQAFLQQVLDRANLTDPAVPDAQVQVWISTNLPPFISAITPAQVLQYFRIVQSRTCQISQQAVALLNSSYSSFSTKTREAIYSQIFTSLQVPEPLRCYLSGSFYSYLQSSFMSFQFPSLPDFLSLMPPARLPELLNSISTAELYSFLSRTSTINNQTQLCEIFNNYQRTPEYLQNEPVVSAAVGRQTLGCVWSRALSASSQDEVAQWFNVRLAQYLPFLSSQLISPTQLSGASCLAFRKFVSVMGNYNYNSVDFTQQDVYNTIQAYLSTGSTPKCYNSSDPVLSSTSWFVDYIGVFITFISVNDLVMFGGTALEIFTVDLKNLQLFSEFSVPSNVTALYVQLLYEFSPSFSATLLPPLFRCSAPAAAFMALNSSQATSIAESLKLLCTDIDPTVSAALAQNVGSLTNSSITALGNSSVGLSTGQITNTPPSVLLSSLSILSSVVGWSQGQAMVIIQTLLSSGFYKISSSDSLLKLGTLVSGLPSTIFYTVDPRTLMTVIQSQSFVTNIITAPTVVQQSIVNQIITVNASSDAVVNNIPNSMATLIPRNSLLTLSQSSATVLNQKQWKYEQAMLFFDTVAGVIADENT
ncbi:uncharacterized protein LOC118797672, partial [Colossoma macropomum]|uniref:uncharacterized protein LOC118797672 n=1 Tax=Colossoma macropomum TaxID=42526 RepID=UPI00186541D2